MENKRKVKAAFIFDEYMRLENRLPTRKEFEEEFYGEEKPNSRYFYQVRKKWLSEKEDSKEEKSEDGN